MQIGEKIKQRRLELKWTQRDLAARMGYKDHTIITRIEKGKVDLPQSRIELFAKVLGLTVAYLMDWEEVQKKNDAIADIIVRMRTDAAFLEAVKKVNDLDSDKLSSLLALLK